MNLSVVRLMCRLCLPMVLMVLAVAGGTLIGRGSTTKKPQLRWFGQSFYQLTTSRGTRIVFDPHGIEEYGIHRMSADVCLVTHPHEDHNQVAILTNRQQAEVLNALKGEGRNQTWNPIDVRFKDVKIRTLAGDLGTYHDPLMGKKRGKNGLFVVEADGLRFVHLGDLGHELSPEQVKALQPVDVLMIPIGGIYTINGSKARKVVDQLKPTRYILPMHYGTKVYDYLLPPDEFFDDGENVVNMTHTNLLEIPVDEKPETPTVVHLGWKRQ